MSFENAHLQSLLHQGLAEQIGLRLVIYSVKRDSKVGISLVEAVIHPRIHLLPKSADFRVSLLPFEQHFLCLFKTRSILFGLLLRHSAGDKFFHLFLVDVVESHIAVTHEVVSLLAGDLWSLTVCGLQPCKH